MKPKITILLLLACFSFSWAQKIEKTYYDYKKTQIKEEYQVNAAGEKNGMYKGYNEKAIVVEEATFKNGQLNGVYKKYATFNGIRELAQSEMYKDGVLNGPATYYGEKGLVIRTGNYKDGKKDGKWTILEPYRNYSIKDPAMLKGCDYVKREVTFSDDKEMPEGKLTSYFYPNMKTRSVQEYAAGKPVGEHTVYYPDGKIESYYKYGENGKYLIKKLFYPDGKVWENHNWENGQYTYEGYNEDGTPDYTMIDMQKRKKVSDFNTKAWSSILAKDYTAAVGYCQEGLKLDAVNLYLKGNLAHAYLLSGKYEDAYSIYLMYKGENINNKLSWNSMIVQDFKEFKSKGIDSPDMQKLLTQLGLDK